MPYKIAGVDVRKKVLMVVVIDPPRQKRKRNDDDLPPCRARCADSRSGYGNREGKKQWESTAQYWRSVWLELEPYMRLHLARAFSNRAPRGRKHDFKDTERLVRRLIAQEFLSLVPDGEQRTWRSLTRMKLWLRRREECSPCTGQCSDYSWNGCS
jgi:hypothetical protein